MHTDNSAFRKGGVEIQHARLGLTIVTVLSVIALVLTTAFVIGAPARAQNAQCVGSVSNLKWDEKHKAEFSNNFEGDTYVGGDNGLARVAFDWKVDAQANPGDTFTLTLPEQLEAGRRDLTLYDPRTNEEVAQGVYDAKSRKWTFTLTQYAARHGDITGKAFFDSRWSRDNTRPDTSYQLKFNDCGNRTFYLNGKTGVIGPQGTRGEAYKSASADGLTPRWVVGTKTEDRDVFVPVTIVEHGGDGFIMSCEGVTAVSRKVQGGDTDLPKGDRWTCEDNVPSVGKLTIRVHPAKNDPYHRYIYADEALFFNFESTVYDETRSSVTNKADIVYEDTMTKPVEYTYQVPQAGGLGSGFQGTLKVEKKVTGTSAPSAFPNYNFSLQCGNAAEESLEAKPGVPSRTVTQRSSASCLLKEKNLPEGVKVSYEVTTNTGKKPAVQQTAEGLRIVFDRNSATEVTVVATNAYPDVATGKLRIVKKVEGAEKVQDRLDREFSFSYTCGTSEKKSVKVSANKPYISPESYPIGTNCTVQEDKQSAEIDGFVLTDSKILGEGEKLVISDNIEQSSVTASNVYAPKKATFTVRKKLTGDASDRYKDAEFKVNYTCESGATGQLPIKADESKTSEQLPIGDTCTLTEDPPQLPLGIKWTPSFSEENGKIKVGQTADITVTNTFDKLNGGFVISKTVTGTANEIDELKKREYRFSYKCTGEDEKKYEDSFTLGDGKTKVIDTVPVGSQCEVREEDVDTAGKNYDWTSELQLNGVLATDGVARFTVPKKSEKSISITQRNTFSRHRGNFEIKKIVEAPQGVITPRKYAFTWTCGDESETVNVKVDEQGVGTATAMNVPVGVECSVVENDATVSGVDLETEWTNSILRLASAQEKPVVQAINRYKSRTGEFRILKELAGSAADKAADKDFYFDYTCNRGEEKRSGELHVRGAGVTESVTDLPVGAQCEIIERDPMLAGYQWDVAIERSGKFSVTLGEIVIKAVNSFNEVPIPPVPPVTPPTKPSVPRTTPPSPPQSTIVIVPPQDTTTITVPSAERPVAPRTQEKQPQKPLLAKTGASVLGIVFVAGLLVVAGLFLVNRRAKKS